MWSTCIHLQKATQQLKQQKRMIYKLVTSLNKCPKQKNIDCIFKLLIVITRLKSISLQDIDNKHFSLAYIESCTVLFEHLAFERHIKLLTRFFLTPCLK